ncbi:MAG: hypothetical protein WC564_01245 [Patescibacteria group bacterium]|jgi:hypothetical protein
MTAKAFSWPSLFFNSNPEVLTEDIVPLPVFSEAEKQVADKKYSDWERAYNRHNIQLLVGNPDNFILSEAEINYFVTKNLALAKNPPASDVQITLNDNSIGVSGYSLLGPLRGAVDLEGRFVATGTKLKMELTKVKFRGVNFPNFIATSLLNYYGSKLFNFLYSYFDYSSLEVKVKPGELRLEYN